MLTKLIEGFQKVWGAPANWTPETSGECGGLPAKITEVNGIQMWESAWEPTPEELDLLCKGGTIHLYVSAHPHPVVSMNVHPMKED